MLCDSKQNESGVFKNMSIYTAKRMKIKLNWPAEWARKSTIVLLVALFWFDWQTTHVFNTRLFIKMNF